MSTLDKQRYAFLLRLPTDLYDFFKENPGYQNEIALDPNSLDLHLTINTSGKDKHYSANLAESEGLSFFSLSSLRVPTYRCPIKYTGILQKPPNPSQVLEAKEINSQLTELHICDPLQEINQPGNFKLSPCHKALTMLDRENAIKLQIMQKYGTKRKRNSEEEVIKRIKDLFKVRSVWKISQLADETLQPESFIREIMAKIGQKAKIRDLKGYWQLSNL